LSWLPADDLNFGSVSRQNQRSNRNGFDVGMPDSSLATIIRIKRNDYGKEHREKPGKNKDNKKAHPETR
jgi:hypothetical protein